MNRLISAARIGLLVALLSILGACTAPQTRQLVADWPQQLPVSAELVDVPFYPQQRYQCGPAALATVLSYSGVDVSPTELVDEIYLPGREGSLRTEIVTAARARGFIVYRIPQSLRALFAELDAGRPVLVMQNLGFDWIPQWHFAVAVGYSLQKGEIILRSGTIARHGVPFTTFEQTWARGEHWGLVLLEPDVAPVSAEPLDYLRAAAALENRGYVEASARAYKTAVMHWPDNALALIARGNAAFKIGEYIPAERAFRRAIDLETNSVPAWNNLANALAERGCVATARQAAQCALKLSPGNNNILETLFEIESSAVNMTSMCQAVDCRFED